MLYWLFNNLRKFLFFFFLGGPPTQKKQATSLGGPARNLQATSSQENYFNFFLELWDLIGYNYSWRIYESIRNKKR